MKPPVINAIKNLIERRYNQLDILNISWFGGEPLLAKDIILDILTFANNCTKINNLFSLHSSITTNGYLLTDDIFEQLVKLNVTDYQISMDGPKEFHDQTRIKANGKGTFDRIWNNLISIKKVSLDFSITLRLHYHVHNMNHLESFLINFKNEFGEDQRFQCLPHEVEQLGGPNDAYFVNIKQEEKAYIDNIISEILKPKNLFNYDNSSYVCYASKPNSLVIRADGRVGKCTVALNDSRNTIGKINDDGTLNLDNDLTQLWLRGIYSEDKDTLACPMHDFPDFVNISMNKIEVK